MATTITKDLVKQAISLGTLNPRILTDFFYKVKLKAYDYDYLIQEELVDLSTFHNSFYTCFTQSRLVKSAVRKGYYDRVGVLQIDKSMVYYGKRRAYHENTALNNIPLTQVELMAHRDIFKFGVLLFINGAVNTNFTIHSRDDKTLLYFPYNTFIKTVKSTDVIDTAFIPRCVIFTSRTLANTDKPDSTSISVNTSTFPNATISTLSECKGFIAFLTPISGTASSLLRTDVTYDATNKKLKFTNGNLPANLALYNITVVGMEDYLSTISYTYNSANPVNYLEIPKQKMPIPKNNLLVLIANDDKISYHLNTTDITITEKYPDIYQITNPGKKDFKIVVLYDSETMNEELNYDTEIDEYLAQVNLLDRYNAGTAPDGLAAYTPIKWDYSIPDYVSQFTPTNADETSWFPLLYKLNKISSIYKLWCYFFEYFIEKTYGFLDGWVLDMSTIDLTSRARTDTLPELNLVSGFYTTFSKPQYMFAYKNSTSNGTQVPYAWFIDGKFKVPNYHVTYKGYDYVYFNQSDISSTSVMEVERYDENIWTKTLIIPADGLDVKLSWITEPILANSIYFHHTDGSFITNGKEYTVSITDDMFGQLEVDMNKSVYKLMPNETIHIAPVSADYADKTIYMSCNNHCYTFNMTFSNDYSSFNDMNLNLNKTINISKPDFMSRIRIFNAEGRMFPKYAYRQIDSANYNALTAPKFQVNVPVSEGNPFQIEYMGYDEVKVYSLDEIPVTSYGTDQSINCYLDLEGKLPRPFSLKYYDVFLNGYKLNKSQIKIIAPFFIAIQGVKTRKALVIYQKVRGQELFDFNAVTVDDSGEKSQYIADKLFNTDAEYYKTVLSKLTDIVEDPSITDMINEANAVRLTFYLDWVGKTFINADTKYPAAELEAVLPNNELDIIFGTGWRYLFNSDERKVRNVDIRNVFFLNHDLNITANGE